MQIPQGIQLPLYEPIYDRNGQLSQVWVMFFETIVQLLNNAKLADLLVLMQLASQLPDQSKSGQVYIDLAQSQGIVSVVMVPCDVVSLPQPITQTSLEIDKPLEAVFLMSQEVISP